MPTTNKVDLHQLNLKVKKNDFNLFKQKCKDSKVTASSVLRSFIKSYNTDLNITDAKLKAMSKKAFNALVENEVNKRLARQNTNTELISSTEASSMLGMNKKIFYQHVKKGKIPAFKIGNALFSNKKQIEQLIKNKKLKTKQLCQLS